MKIISNNSKNNEIENINIDKNSLTNKL